MEKGFLTAKGRGNGKGVNDKHSPVLDDSCTTSNVESVKRRNKVEGFFGWKKHNVESVVNLNLCTLTDTTSTPAKDANLNNTNVGPVSFATLLKRDTSRKSVNFRTLVTPAGNGADVVVPKESLSVVNKRLSNTIFKDGIESMLENDDGLSAIATKLGKPLMFDSNTAAICTNSWVRASYARAMVELRADVELKDIIMVVVPKFNLKNPRLAVRGVQVGLNVGFKQTQQVYRPVSQKNSVSTSGKKSNLYCLDTRQMSDGKLMLVDDDMKTLNKVGYAPVNSNSVSDVEVAYMRPLNSWLVEVQMMQAYMRTKIMTSMILMTLKVYRNKNCHSVIGWILIFVVIVEDSLCLVSYESNVI
ncbi:hypothetical protein Tco_1509709 [Tanacetum coccineum]